jgi:hypothetical protein
MRHPECTQPNHVTRSKVGDKRVTVKTTGVRVDYLVRVDYPVDTSPEIYGPYVVIDKHKRVI